MVTRNLSIEDLVKQEVPIVKPEKERAISQIGLLCTLSERGFPSEYIRVVYVIGLKRIRGKDYLLYGHSFDTEDGTLDTTNSINLENIYSYKMIAKAPFEGIS